MSWIHLAVVAALVGLLGLFGWTAYGLGKSAGSDQMMARWQASELERSKAVADAQLRQLKAQEAERQRIEKERQDHAQALARAASDAAGARSELERLRSAIKALAPGGAGVPQAPAPAPGAADPGAFPELLAECAGSHQELAAETDRLAIQVKALLELVAR